MDINDSKKNDAINDSDETETMMNKTPRGGGNKYLSHDVISSFDSIDNDSGLLDMESIDFLSMFNSLDLGLCIFHGVDEKEIIPKSCNDSYLRLSGLTREEFLNSVNKSCLYGVHPDDIQIAREAFISCYKNHQPTQINIRIIIKNKGFCWVNLFSNIKFLKDGSFDLYMIFHDASEIVNDEQVKIKRHHSLIDEVINHSKDYLALCLCNLTKNTFHEINCSLKVKHQLIKKDEWNDFVSYVLSNVYDVTHQDLIRQSLSCKQMLENYRNGKLTTQFEIPIILVNNTTIWCHLLVNVIKNPETKDIEALIYLKEANKEIRIHEFLKHIIDFDYEFVAFIDVKTRLITVLSENKKRNSSNLFKGTHTYEESLVVRISELVDDNLIEMCIDQLRLDSIVNALDESDKAYIVTYPAKKDLVPDGGVFQWSFSYASDKKDEIIMTRREMIGVLTHSQREVIAFDEKQEQSNLLGQQAIHGFAKRDTILIADDALLNREMLKIMFEDEFKIIEANDGEEAIQLLDKYHDNIALLLLDYKMPIKTGLDVVIHLKVRNLDGLIPVMMVTGSSDEEIKLQSFDYGVSDIVNKPFDARIVKRRALNLIELFAHKESAENQVNQWKMETLKLQEQAQKNDEMMINTLSSVVEFRSKESGLHIKRVRALTEILANAWKGLYPDSHLSDESVKLIARASTLHDIGKVAIPDAILMKPGKLTKEEFDIMKTHTTLGSEMIETFKTENNEFYTYSYDICKYHHERDDGRGYPCGLKGDEIPIWAQIVSVVDVFDALISPRVYKSPFPYDTAIEMIVNGECGKFSDKVINCFFKSIDLIKEKSILLQEKRD